MNPKETSNQGETSRIFWSIPPDETLKLRPPETEFEHGIRHFGYLLMQVTFVLLITVFAIKVFFSRPSGIAYLFIFAEETKD